MRHSTLLAGFVLLAASAAMAAPNCWTNGNALVASSAADLERLLGVYVSGDRIAWQRLVEAGEVRTILHGTPIYVDVPHVGKPQAGPVVIRREGKVERLWTDWQWIACER